MHNSRTSTYIIYTDAKKLGDRFVTNRKKYNSIKDSQKKQSGRFRESRYSLPILLMTFYRRIILGSNFDNLLSYVVLTLSVVGSIDYLLRW